MGVQTKKHNDLLQAPVQTSRGFKNIKELGLLITELCIITSDKLSKF